jgi:hypothetical protein
MNKASDLIKHIGIAITTKKFVLFGTSAAEER